MLIYLDTCCLNRPYDDQLQTRIQMETAAVLAVMQRVVSGQCELANSEVLTFEIHRNPDQTRQDGILNFLDYAAKFQSLDHAVEQRGTFLHGLGFKRFDALHLAAAEALAVDIFLTTDDRFAACATRNAAELSLPVMNPMLFPTI